MNTEEETHEPKFRGWFIPADVVNLYLEKEVTAKELILLATIDSLISSKRRACFASNKWLAQRTGFKTSRGVQVALEKLKARGLVLSKKSDTGRRILSTIYSNFLRPRPTNCSSPPTNARSSPHEQQFVPPRTRVRVDLSMQESKQAQSVARAARDVVKGRGFFDTDAKKSFAQTCAEKLREVIARHNKIQRKVSISKWTTEVQTLIQETSKERVKEAIKFYRLNFGKKYIPIIYSASALRAKFAQLEDAMSRDRAPSDNKPNEAKAMFDELYKTNPLFARVYEKTRDTLSWPGAARAQLAEAFATSWSNYDAFMSRLARRVGKHVDNPKHKAHELQSFHKSLMTWTLQVAECFLFAWFEKAARRVRSWKDWSGDMSVFTFHDKHPEFVRACEACSINYSGSTKYWDLTLRLLNEN